MTDFPVRLRETQIGWDKALIFPFSEFVPVAGVYFMGITPSDLQTNENTL